MGAFDTVSSALSLTGKLLKLPAVVQNADAQLLISELKVELAKGKAEVAELMERLLAVESEKKQIQAMQAAPIELESRDGVYWVGEKGPYCPNCYDLDHQRVQMEEMGKVFHSICRYRCHRCQFKCGGKK